MNKPVSEHWCLNHLNYMVWMRNHFESETKNIRKTFGIYFYILIVPTKQIKKEKQTQWIGIEEDVIKNTSPLTAAAHTDSARHQAHEHTQSNVGVLFAYAKIQVCVRVCVCQCLATNFQG